MLLLSLLLCLLPPPPLLLLHVLQNAADRRFLQLHIRQQLLVLVLVLLHVGSPMLCFW